MFDFMNDEPLPPAPKRSSLTAALMEEANPEPLQPTFSEEPSVPTSTVTTTAASSATANSPEPPSTPNFNKRPTYSATRPSMFDMKPRFVINFISACDIPAADFRSKCDPYLRAFISKHDDNEVDSEGRKVFRLKRISNYVCTPKKLDCKSAVWNCYRDFRLIPPEGSILTVEMYHTTSDSTKPDNLLGKVDIAIASLNDETSKTFYLVNFKVRHLTISNQSSIDCHFDLFSAFLVGIFLRRIVKRIPSFQ